jgi:hypothetical protein
MTKVSLSVIQSASEARKFRLPEFAKSFDHRLEPAYPILVGWIAGEIRGYAQLERRWLVTPAIHTGLNSPRDTYLLARATIETLKQTCPGFLVQREQETDKVFTDSVMEKFGLVPWPYRVFSPE